jgi:hypothetical protein
MADTPCWTRAFPRAGPCSCRARWSSLRYCSSHVSRRSRRKPGLNRSANSKPTSSASSVRQSGTAPRSSSIVLRPGDSLRARLHAESIPGLGPCLPVAASLQVLGCGSRSVTTASSMCSVATLSISSGAPRPTWRCRLSRRTVRGSRYPAARRCSEREISRRRQRHAEGRTDALRLHPRRRRCAAGRRGQQAFLIGRRRQLPPHRHVDGPDRPVDRAALLASRYPGLEFDRFSYINSTARAAFDWRRPTGYAGSGGLYRVQFDDYRERDHDGYSF